MWKEIRYGRMSEKEKSMLVSEVNILRELKHPNIVRYKVALAFSSCVCIISASLAARAVCLVGTAGWGSTNPTPDLRLFHLPT